MIKLYYHLGLLILAVSGVSAGFYFKFTAEDAYITYRYAENFVNIGSLVYNEGEPINAMTSPLHALLSAALFYLTGQTVLSIKSSLYFYCIYRCYSFCFALGIIRNGNCWP